VLKPLAMKLGLAKLTFQVLRRTMATQSIEDSVKQTQEAIYAELTARPKLVGSIKKGKNLVRFGTVGVLDSPQVIVPQGQGA
jgi:hypothetical protein